MTARLSGKVAIVTGGAQGMGAAHARGIVREGGSVVIGDVATALGSALADELGSAAVFVHHDVSNEASWANVVDETLAAFGGIDILVNNAGIAVGKPPLVDTSLADWERVVAVNQTGVFLGMRSVIVPMARRGGGSIINISSVAGVQAVALLFAYTATKYAVTGMTNVAALELGPLGIRVNSVHPGRIRTPLAEAVTHLGDADVEARLTSKIPLGRIADSDEVTQAVIFLASDESSYITGTQVPIDGGLRAGLGFDDVAVATAAVAAHLEADDRRAGRDA